MNLLKKIITIMVVMFSLSVSLWADDLDDLKVSFKETEIERECNYYTVMSYLYSSIESRMEQECSAAGREGHDLSRLPVIRSQSCIQNNENFLVTIEADVFCKNAKRKPFYTDELGLGYYSFGYHNLTHQQATEFCETKGMRLPSKVELDRLYEELNVDQTKLSMWFSTHINAYATVVWSSDKSSSTSAWGLMFFQSPSPNSQQLRPVATYGVDNSLHANVARCVAP